MADIIFNKLEIINDYKKNAVVNQEDINNDLIYSSLVTINLIDTIKEYYGIETTLSVDTSDEELQAFLETSFKNFFLEEFTKKYKIENVNNKGFISKLIQKSNNTESYVLKEENYDDYELPIIDLDEYDRDGIDVIDKGSNIIELSHSNIKTGENNNYTQNIGTNGYNTSLSLNSYLIEKKGHVQKNNKITVYFPSSANLEQTLLDVSNINTYRFGYNFKDSITISLTNRYLTLFIFTFYCDEYDKYYTAYVSVKDMLGDGCIKVVTNDNYTPFIYVHFIMSSDRSTITLNCYIDVDRFSLYLRRIKAAIIA